MGEVGIEWDVAVYSMSCMVWGWGCSLWKEGKGEYCVNTVCVKCGGDITL